MSQSKIKSRRDPATPQSIPDKDGDGYAICNRSGNTPFQEIAAARYDRRGVMKGGVGAAVTAGMFTPAAAEAGFWGTPHDGAWWRGESLPSLDFEPLSASSADEVRVAEGYAVQVFIPWGTPITGDYPEFVGGGHNTGDEQAQQVGMHHDGMHYFPMGRGRKGSMHGILCINHEYMDGNILHPNGQTWNGPPGGADSTRSVADEVKKEIAAHGVSIVEMAKQGRRGEWEVVRGKFNRRITADTPMEFTGPVRNTDFVKTKFSPNGTMARGTLNNCANGYTPWGTYLTCEENWRFYFFNDSAELPREQVRYGVLKKSDGVGFYGWGTRPEDPYARFDVTPKSAGPTEDYRNEANTFGWIVEIDPFDPKSTPKKRTAMGRFAHEGVVMHDVREGQPVVAYSGDDDEFEYIYKFVSKKRYSRYRDNTDILAEGTLYAAKFNADGSGEWLPLVFGRNSLTPENGFHSQADVLVNTRTAADFVGATPMDRPEWGAIHPKDGTVYMNLTDNEDRNTETASNPRAPNPYGHMIRWTEGYGRPWSRHFDWDIFVLAGPPGNGKVFTEEGQENLTADNDFSSPDGLWFDKSGILWIETDGYARGNDQILAAVPETGDIRRFLTGPDGCEITGLTGTPDRDTLFANIQHPGSNDPSGSTFPDGPGARPRSATLLITRDDGGPVGGAVERHGHSDVPGAWHDHDDPWGGVSDRHARDGDHRGDDHGRRGKRRNDNDRDDNHRGFGIGRWDR